MTSTPGISAIANPTCLAASNRNASLNRPKVRVVAIPTSHQYALSRRLNSARWIGDGHAVLRRAAGPALVPHRGSARPQR